MFRFTQDGRQLGLCVVWKSKTPLNKSGMAIYATAHEGWVCYYMKTYHCFCFVLFRGSCLTLKVIVGGCVRVVGLIKPSNLALIALTTVESYARNVSDIGWCNLRYLPPTPLSPYSPLCRTSPSHVSIILTCHIALLIIHKLICFHFLFSSDIIIFYFLAYKGWSRLPNVSGISIGIR